MSPQKSYEIKAEGRDLWRDIPGFGGKYQASRDGNIRRVLRPGLARDMVPYRQSPAKQRRHKNRKVYVKLTPAGDKPREYLISKLVAATFLPPPPRSGMVLYHKNYIINDNRVDNLAYTTRSELSKKTGHRTENRRSVLKINREGEVVEIYRSAREAAKMNPLSRQTITDRCNNKIKNPYELDGFNYQWEE